MTRKKMTQKELIKEIAKRVKDIKELYYSAYPEGNYLTLYFQDGNVSFNNENWDNGKDKNYPIDYWESEKIIIINGIWEKK